MPVFKTGAFNRSAIPPVAADIRDRGLGCQAVVREQRGKKFIVFPVPRSHSTETSHIKVTDMVDLYFWPTPNGYKIALFMEESGLDYKVVPVDIGAGDQFKPDFLAFSPNNRMPAIVDHAPVDGSAPQTVFESGAILHYLGMKTGQFWPTAARDQIQVMEWLMWQMGGLGPMAGQNHHFNVYAPETIPYAQKRYTDETSRLYGVLNKRLEGRDFIVEDYSIADMACYPWINSYERQKQDLDDFPNLKAWYERIQARPATQRAYEMGESLGRKPNFTAEEKAKLFGQDKDTVK